MNKEKEDALFKLILCNNETHRFWLSDDDIEEEIDLYLDTYLDY